MSKDQNLINVSEKTFSDSIKAKEVSVSSPESFSSTGNLSTTLNQPILKRVVDTNILLDYIREHQPVSMWAISKSLEIPNSSLYYRLRDLEFAGVIFSKIITNDKNRQVRMIYSSSKKKKTGDTDGTS
jgi:predicted transcriptional regulator